MASEYVNVAYHAEKEKRIISIARLEEQKNQKMLINSFAKFRLIHPEYKLVIYGKGSLLPVLKSQIDRLGLHGSVLLPGVVENVFDHLKKSEFFVLSSNFEGMPNTLIEAMCVGLPCISTKVSGAVDLIENEVNGLLVNIDHEMELYEAMCKIAGDSNLRTKIGNNASKLYNRLNIDVIFSEWKRIVNLYIA